MPTKDTPIKRHIIAVDAPVGTVFTVYGEDPENRIRFQLNIAWTSAPYYNPPARRQSEEKPTLM